MSVPAFWLEKKLMMIVFWENAEFIFYTRTVTGTTAADQPIEKRGVLEPVT